MEQIQEKSKGRIRDWKGILHDESMKTKAMVFVALLVVSVSMTFTQFGFIGIGTNGEYVGYALGLLGPLSAVALLLGKGAGTLFGLFNGVALFAHANLQPLDLFERYLVSSPNGIVVYAFLGFLLGLMFAVALRNNPQKGRRRVYLGIACALASFVASTIFVVNSLITFFFELVASLRNAADATIISSEWVGALDVVRGTDAQFFIDAIFMLAVCLLADRIVRRRAEVAGSMSVRTTFQTQLFMMTALVFCIVQALSFAAITIEAERQALNTMDDELSYLEGRLRDEVGYGTSTAEGSAESAETAGTSSASANVEKILNGYDLEDGTVAIFLNDTIVASYNPACPVGATAAELFDTRRTGTLEEIAETGRLRPMLYDTRDLKSDGGSYDLSTATLGYMRVKYVDDYAIMIAKPSSMVFANRQATMLWATLLAAALLATIYVLATRLINRDIIGPVDRINASLARITSGNLDEVVSEKGNHEFASLSEGINQTVGALKDLITEAELRNERDLATARVIQESALPRTFPPFPGIDAFDIFASMDAAKEVGGDFYDFFLIDDQTLGFLIADVSGKGIPGALFMMAAKTELENYLSTGMTPAEAITAANQRLCTNNEAGMFVTVWAATLNWKTGELVYVNAAHNYPLLCHEHNGTWEWLDEKCGLFLGAYETAKYRQETIVLAPGDELVLYTDGVNEAFNLDDEQYGNDRLESFLATHADMHPRELVQNLRSNVAKWANGAEQSDDVTILALEFGTAPDATEQSASQ